MRSAAAGESWLPECLPDFPWELVRQSIFLLLCVEFEYSGKDYDQATYTFQTHNLIDSSHALSFWLPVLVGIVGLVLFALVQTGTVAAAGFCRCSGRGAGGKYHADTSGSADCRTGRSSQVSGLVFLPLSRQSAAVVCDGNPPAYRRTDKASAGTTDSIPAALGASAVSVFRKRRHIFGWLPFCWCCPLRQCWK